MGMQMTLLRGRSMRMPSRLEQVEHVLCAAFGGRLLEACPELAYTVNELLFRFMRTSDSLALLWQKLDSALFNSVYQATGGKMRVTLDNGEKRLVTSDMLRDLSDRLLALSYARMDVSPTLTDALFDLSREGSFAAMRELVRRFPLDDIDRKWLLQVLEENGQAQ